jgi:isohexenylglutaconyl-CoA hydratase
MTTLPLTEHIQLERQGPVLRLWLNRPEMRNALSAQMSAEIIATFEAIRDNRDIRVVVMRGSGGTFCAGGDIRNMQASGAAPPPGAPDPLREGNRRFGTMMQMVNTAPQAVIIAVEGFAMGGGFGLACVGDITIATADATFAMSETTLGIVPAAISPFVVQRIGLTAARRFGVSGARLDGRQAQAIGIAHDVAADATALEPAVTSSINLILRCAPGAVAETKKLMHRAAAETDMTALLDYAATSFTTAVRSAEGREGTLAFVEKRKPAWAMKIE